MKIIVLLCNCFAALVTGVGERAFRQCAEYGHSMLECQNILKPQTRVRVPVDLLQFPHMVLIGFPKEDGYGISWECGGSLVSDRWVLTAAHCRVNRQLEPPKKLRIGTATFEFDEVDDLAQERDVAELVVHPGYKPPEKYNDIALIRSVKPFILNRDIRITCLQQDDKFPVNNLTVIGFGTTVSGAATGSETLMRVDVDVVDGTLCNRSMKTLIKRKLLTYGIMDTQLCAGDYANGGRDTCQGDSGGPLQYMPDGVDCKLTFPLYYQVGVTSFGRDCGRKMAPGVYSKVSKYIDWIEGIVWP